VNGGPDAPDPSDRTMWRLEALEAFDEWLPQWRSMVGQPSRNGWQLGWLDPTTPPAGALLAKFADAAQSTEATALPWREPGPYYLLRPPEISNVWTRVLPRYPATYTVEAVGLTSPAEPDRDIRRWNVLTAQERPVTLTDADSAHPRAWLLREDLVYDIGSSQDTGETGNGLILCP
jgi:hypothetical protein